MNDDDGAQKSAPIPDEFPDLPVDSPYEAWELADIEHDLAMYYADLNRGGQITGHETLKARFDAILTHNNIPLPTDATWEYNPVMGRHHPTLKYKRNTDGYTYLIKQEHERDAP